MIANFSKNQIVVSISIIILVFAVLAIPYYIYNRNIGNTIYPHTYVDGIDMGYKSKKEAEALLQRRDDYLKNVSVKIMYQDMPIATFSAEQLDIHRDIQTKVDQAYIVGRTPDLTSRFFQQLNSILGFQKITFQTTMTYYDEPVSTFIQNTADSYNMPAKNALFQFEDGKVVSFKADEKGIEILTDEFMKDFRKEIESISDKKTQLTVTVKDSIIEPEITLAEANNHGVEELIAEGKSDYSHSIPSRVHNVILAASKFNGVLIPKGAEFSFNSIIGDISSTTGYQPAYVIQNGRTVLGDGGGVCQVSTTAFRAALNAGLPITERSAHAYRVSYYENDSDPGFDATIYVPTVDLKFKNDTPASILIMTEIDEENMILTFKFYGKKDDRQIELSPVTIWDVAPAPEPLYEDDPTLPVGQVRQVDYAASGAKTKFTYKVTKGDEVKEETFTSIFRPWRAVYLRGTKEG
ncbi:MAG TPA: VanW family protein [Candidatus Woesebacteria bacterium]|nr:VanW family protein [Candidatus Woesebacteria bacterium]